jgi:hypothetical protein
MSPFYLNNLLPAIILCRAIFISSPFESYSWCPCVVTTVSTVLACGAICLCEVSLQVRFCKVMKLHLQHGSVTVTLHIELHAHIKRITTLSCIHKEKRNASFSLCTT